jgi:hypothetical protein
LDHLRVQLHPGIDRLGQGKDPVVVGHLQGVGALPLAPILGGLTLAARAVAVATGVVEAALLSTALTFQARLTEGFGPTGQKVVTDLPLAGVEAVA